MRFRYSLRVKLTILFLIVMILPVLVIIFALPTVYRNLFTSESETLTQALLTSLTRNIETYLDDLDRLTIAPYLYSDVMRALQLKASGSYPSADGHTKYLSEQALNTALPEFLLNPRQDIAATIMLPMDGSVYISSRDTSGSVSGYPFTQQSWYRQAIQADGKVAFVSTHPQDYLPLSPQKQVFSVARLIKDPDSRRPLAVMMADADTRVLSKITSDLQLNVNSIVAVLDSNHQLIFSSAPLSDTLLKQIADQSPALEGDGDSFVSVSRTIESSQWAVVILQSSSEINAKLRWIYVIGILFALGGLVLAFVVFFTLSRWIVDPFQDMIQVMKRVQRGDLASRFKPQGRDEIAELGDALNTMIGRLSDLIDREYKAVLNQRNAEFMALQAQIQPHFLYNTLNSFIALNRLREQAALERAIYALSNMLRYTLRRDEWATIKEEFQFLQRYCELQRLRFEDRLNVEIQFEPEASAIKIPRLLLQPLVENAIIHGIEPLAKSCMLIVSAELEQREDGVGLKISIQDDGAGFDTAAQPVSGCIGLSNVRERLKVAYPGSSFVMTSDLAIGTRILIRIPLEQSALVLGEVTRDATSAYRG